MKTIADEYDNHYDNDCRWIWLWWWICYVVDVATCSVNNGGCDHTCITEPKGGYHCVCRSGYTLLTDGHSCSGTLYP